MVERKRMAEGGSGYLAPCAAEVGNVFHLWPRYCPRALEEDCAAEMGFVLASVRAWGASQASGEQVDLRSGILQRACNVSRRCGQEETK